MLVSFPLVPDTAPVARTPRGRGRIVWQQRYEGIARIAYRGGRAIAGVSGPWSDRYALIWWDEQPLTSNPLELFETLEAAMDAVERHAGEALPASEPMSNSAGKRGTPWWKALWPSSRRQRISQLRRRGLDTELDLSGLNFSASS